MIKLKGSVTTVERMDVEVSPEQIRAAANTLFTPYEIIRMSFQVWLADRRLGMDVELKQNSRGEYYFLEYENNGSHYSGYFDRPGAYREGDEVIFAQYQELMKSLK